MKSSELFDKIGADALRAVVTDFYDRVFRDAMIGFMFQGCCMAIYTSRELALDPRLFSALTATNHLGGTLFAYSALALLWYYPSRIGHLPFATFTYGAAALVWLNETLQVVQSMTT